MLTFYLLQLSYQLIIKYSKYIHALGTQFIIYSNERHFKKCAVASSIADVRAEAAASARWSFYVSSTFFPWDDRG